MLCENCKKREATVFYEENINGRKTSYKLCPDCAAEKGVNIPDFGREMLNFGGDLFGGGLFGGLLNAALPRHARIGVPREARGEKRCPVCGSTLADITRNGRLGCGECYSVFGGMPLPKPQKQPDEQPPENAAPTRDELKEAVAAENFEEAARIRDVLRGKKNA